MNFNSTEYLVFLPAVFLLYWFVFKKSRTQNLLVVVASYIFYGLWDWKCLALIFATSSVSYLCGIALGRNDVKERLRPWISGFNILFNLAILAVFKYYNFFGESFAALLGCAGVNAGWVTTDIILPVGISFYTFQALGYTIDVYRRWVEPARDFVAFMAFISFFPQLVAGPIERASNLLPQFLSPRRFNYAKAVDGMRLILLGLAKKMLVADNCAAAVDTIFENWQQLDGGTLLYGAVLFAFQIYGDFSGYSDIARGSGKLLGIELMRNFRYPYFSRDIAEFWRRWHISLNTWFRDYVYIPLGGSRCGKVKIIRNTFVIFLLSGLWHGADWTFLCWGAYNALLFIPLLLSGSNRKNMDTVAAGRRLPSCKELLQMLQTFLAVTFGWIFFRAESVGQAVGYVTRIFTCFTITVPQYGQKAFFFVALLLLAEWSKRHKEHPLEFDGRGVVKYRFVRMALYFVIFMAALLLAGDKVDFIYFQF